MNKFSFLILVPLCWLTAGFAQTRLTVEDFSTRDTFQERKVSGINWMNNGKYYSALSDNKVIQYDITSGQPVRVLVDGSALSSDIIIDDYSFSGDETKMLLQTQQQSIYRRSYTAEYFVYNLTTQRLLPLSSKGAQSYATFSPDGSKIAFVRSNNLFYVTVSDMKEEQVTNDGKFGSIINGTTDWVYEEEFSFVVGFAWSPDSRKLAYYRFDETEVPEYNLQYWAGLLYPYDYRYKYPKAGEKNSVVEIWSYDLTSKQKVKADTGADSDIYIPKIKWTANPNILSIRRLNRLQNHMQLIHADVLTGKSDVILDERTDTYFDIEVLDILYLENGKEFIQMSEQEGYMQLYLNSITGDPIRKLTTGKYDVTQFVGAHERNKLLYFVSTEPSPLERHFYVMSFDGKRKTRLSDAAGVHSINMSNDFQFYIDHHSSSSQPTIVTLYRTRSKTPVKVLERNDDLVRKIKEFGIVPKEFFTFKNAGVELHGFMLKPANFDSAKEYPVMLFQYSGPGSQEVQNNWSADHFYFHQMLVQEGFIVAFIDPRGTGGRGEVFKKATYKQLGKLELEDHLAGARFLASLNYIDEDRMGIWGWSYGGYMSSLALTKGAGVFRMGIAVSPVTNWRFYDTIYTERYLQTPQLNADGYDLNSPSTYADKLEGEFLLVHGTGDDNVHIQNSIVLQDALINAGVSFESFFYPDKHHALEGPQTRHHLYSMMLDFIVKNL